MEPPGTLGKSKTRALGKIRRFAAETPVFPANIWKPDLERLNIRGEGQIGPATAGNKSLFPPGTKDSQFRR
jgi:hypothetical protein